MVNRIHAVNDGVVIIALYCKATDRPEDYGCTSNVQISMAYKAPVSHAESYLNPHIDDKKRLLRASAAGQGKVPSNPYCEH